MQSETPATSKTDLLFFSPEVEGSVTFENIFSSIDEESFWLCGKGWSTMSLRGFFLLSSKVKPATLKQRLRLQIDWRQKRVLFSV